MSGPVLNKSISQADEAKIIERIHKLLALAGNNSNKEEAEAAAAKANALQIEYNISVAELEASSGIKSGRREELKTKGGFYAWQRELWTWIAEMHHCVYWTQKVWHEIQWQGRPYSQRKRQHRIVGRAVNVASAKAMAEYLQQTIDRIVKGTLTEDEGLREWQRAVQGTYAHSFRVGMAEEFMSKIAKRYRKTMAEEQVKMEAARRQANETAAAGHSTSTAVVMTNYKQSERDANLDHAYGEGYSARKAAREAADAKARKEAHEAYTRWAKENPEDARKQEEKAEKAAERAARRSSGSDRAADKLDYGAYNRGRKAAEKIGIDPQVDAGGKGRLLG